MDIFVAIITVPTLILLALLLDANLQENLCNDDETSTRSSFIVLIFGFGFLLISLLVCGCIVHKMGLCLWTRPMLRRHCTEHNSQLHSTRVERRTPHIESNAGNGVDVGNSSDARTNDYSHIIDMPPSYESVINAYKLHSPASLTSTAAAAAIATGTTATITMTMSSSSAATLDAAPPPPYESICHEKDVVIVVDATSEVSNHI